MSQDNQARKWQITINNPLDKGFDHNKIKATITGLQSLVYYCMADEAGQTYHTHVYIVCSVSV